MTKSQTALIREASKKEVGANRWLQRMEKWSELQRSPIMMWNNLPAQSWFSDDFAKRLRWWKITPSRIS